MFRFWHLAVFLMSAVSVGQEVPVLNASFEHGDLGLTSWSTSKGSASWEQGNASKGQKYISVKGNGTDMSYWRSAPVDLAPGRIYRIDFSARSRDASGGTPVTGPVFCNVDLGAAATDWQRHSYVFTVPDDLRQEDTWLRFGQWHVNGSVDFDDIELTEVIPVYSSHREIALGEGEEIRRGGVYVFNAPLNDRGRNHSRPLSRTTCGFNSNRWVFGENDEVIYRHMIGDVQQTQGMIEITLNYHTGGELAVDASADGSSWTPLGTQSNVGALTANLPKTLLPTNKLWIRLRARARHRVGAAESDPGAFQVNSYVYKATLGEEFTDFRGSTTYMSVPQRDRHLSVSFDSLGKMLPGKKHNIVAHVSWTGKAAIGIAPRVALTQNTETVTFTGKASSLVPGANKIVCEYNIPRAGEWDLDFALGGELLRTQTQIYVPEFYSTSYGKRLTESNSGVTLWWCNSGWKIPRTRCPPTEKSHSIDLSTAKGEAEAVQLVVHSETALSQLKLAVTDLHGPDGLEIASGRVDILQVYYHQVTRKTDHTGILDDWPDALPPVPFPCSVEPSRNQPFWLRIRAPRNIPAGLYTGKIQVTAENFQKDIDLRVRVFDFELPERMSCSTAFGFSFASVCRYQRLTEIGNKRTVLAKYLQNFSEHHISPYDPAPLDHFAVDWPRDVEWEGGMRDRNNPFAGVSSLKLDDSSVTENVSAECLRCITIPPVGIRLRFSYRTTTPDHSFLVTLTHHDEHGEWMSGKNNDMPVLGSASWTLFDRAITQFPSEARSVRLRLWATRYSEAGNLTGTVWFDDVSLVDAKTGKGLIELAGFEPITPDHLQPRFSWTAWDRAMEDAMERYHFNSFRLPLKGLGGGTFHSRREPSLLGYPEGTPEYRTAFSRYVNAIESHLRDRGWLEEAYVYWFDEPDPKDYTFVMNGFSKLKASAPSLRRMLTEQVEEELTGGPDLWCPVSSAYNDDRAEKRRQQGDDFWWYVCTGPKAPYCTLFIDHPATELRVWLWQTWKRRISGILVWQSNYWTSGAAYTDPSAPQNPYTDPMGWVSGYSTPAGTRRAWGNGDGRFIYPPLSAADAAPEQPVLQGPVDSIRWEMLRDGIEDYEYHAILSRLLQRKSALLPAAEIARLRALLVIPAEISADTTHFTTDPAPLMNRRKELAEAIEYLVHR